MLKIALTGNIASGKTTVQNYLETLGFKILCLDEAVNFFYENDIEFQNELIKNFKTKNKKEISNIVFSDFDKLKKIEKIIYPKLILKIENFFKENKEKKSVIVSAAVLFESGFDKYFDKIIFVSANEETRLKRLMKRNNLNYDEAKKRINSQMPEKEKIKKSNYIIYNNGTKEELFYNNKNVIEELSTLL